MKSVLLIAFFSAFSFIGSAQQNALHDSLSKSICLTIEHDSINSDSVKIMSALNKHLIPYVRSLGEKNLQQLYEIVLFRLYKICPEFKSITDRKFPPKDDFREVSIEPKSNIDISICDSFFKLGEFKYLESNGDSTKVIFNDSVWIDHFKDGSFSKLKLEKINNCEIQITFLESNNLSRIGLNNPGEKYRYKLLRKTRDYYEIFVKVVNSSKKSITKFYY